MELGLPQLPHPVINVNVLYPNTVNILRFQGLPLQHKDWWGKMVIIQPVSFLCIAPFACIFDSNMPKIWCYKDLLYTHMHYQGFLLKSVTLPDKTHRRSIRIRATVVLWALLSSSSYITVDSVWLLKNV